MATVPLSGTNIRLLSGVPFSNDYKHSRWFDNINDQTNYFQNRELVHTIQQANFQRIEGRSFIAVNLSIDALWGTNYVMFQNAEYNNKWFYGFVTKLEYKQVNTTYVHFEIDVLQTWRFEMNFKPSYVVREHCKLFNADGSPVINTVEEGLEYGSEYDTVAVDNYKLNGGLMFLVIVTKETLHNINGLGQRIASSKIGTIQPLSFYIHPFDINGITPDIWLHDQNNQLADIQHLLNAIYSLDSSVNNVVSLYITEHVGIDFNYNGGQISFDEGVFGHDFEVVTIEGSSLQTIYVDGLTHNETTTVLCKNKYQDYTAVEESKLMMYPYSFSIIGDFKGNMKVLKNEFIIGNNLLMEVMGSLGVSNKVAYIPSNYVVKADLDHDLKIKVGLENALIDQSPHDISILNEMLSAFLQGNRNSLVNQAHSIYFNGMADVVGSGIGAVSSALTLNTAGVASSTTNMIKGAGNTVLQIEGLQAKVKDINNIPPQLGKMGSNTSFEYGNDYMGFWVIKKQIKPEYRKKLTDFFKMFGYKVNELKIPNFHTRLSWNYVQTLACNIVGSFNNEDLQELKNVFDNGITLWHTDNVGEYGLPNGVIA